MPGAAVQQPLDEIVVAWVMSWNVALYAGLANAVEHWIHRSGATAIVTLRSCCSMVATATPRKPGAVADIPADDLHLAYPSFWHTGIGPKSAGSAAKGMSGVIRLFWSGTDA